ncbi:MAG: protein kinase [Anaerolineae bacterium]|nr:protein kinase [Anaerolineae bacterium]
MQVKSQLGLTGTSFGRYRIDEFIGSGGMAAVYKGFDTRLERHVAVKVLPQYTQTEEYIARFEREAKAMARLFHPHIVSVHDFGQQEGNLYLVMDFISGGTLEKRLKGIPVPCLEAVRFLLPVVYALGYAHSQGVIHRDVKPANILMDADKRPVLSDFGIAKVVMGENVKPVTRTGVGLGTPDYMAPEQGLGREVDGRADIYSLGVIFYEMLVGEKPYPQGHGMQIMMMHIMDPFPHPCSKYPDTPQQVERVLMKMVEKDPRDRYQSMAELAQALQELQPGSAAVSNVSGLFSEESMMFRIETPDAAPRSCPACGQPVRQGDKFCAQCGSALEADTREKQPQPAEAQPAPPQQTVRPGAARSGVVRKAEAEAEPAAARPAHREPTKPLPGGWELEVISGTHPGRRIPLTEKMIAGRSQGNEIWVNNNNASRRHAEILHVGDAYQVRDLGSTNGTWVNSKRIEGPVLLKENDTIIIGDTEFILRSAS